MAKDERYFSQLFNLEKPEIGTATAVLEPSSPQKDNYFSNLFGLTPSAPTRNYIEMPKRIPVNPSVVKQEAVIQPPSATVPTVIRSRNIANRSVTMEIPQEAVPQFGNAPIVENIIPKRHIDIPSMDKQAYFQNLFGVPLNKVKLEMPTEPEKMPTGEAIVTGIKTGLKKTLDVLSTTLPENLPSQISWEMPKEFPPAAEHPNIQLPQPIRPFALTEKDKQTLEESGLTGKLADQATELLVQIPLFAASGAGGEAAVAGLIAKAGPVVKTLLPAIEKISPQVAGTITKVVGQSLGFGTYGAGTTVATGGSPEDAAKAFVQNAAMIGVATPSAIAFRALAKGASPVLQKAFNILGSSLGFGAGVSATGGSPEDIKAALILGAGFGLFGKGVKNAENVRSNEKPVSETGNVPGQRPNARGENLQLETKTKPVVAEAQQQAQGQETPAQPVPVETPSVSATKNIVTESEVTLQKQRAETLNRLREKHDIAIAEIAKKSALEEKIASGEIPPHELAEIRSNEEIDKLRSKGLYFDQEGNLTYAEPTSEIPARSDVAREHWSAWERNLAGSSGATNAPKDIIRAIRFGQQPIPRAGEPPIVPTEQPIGTVPSSQHLTVPPEAATATAATATAAKANVPTGKGFEKPRTQRRVIDEFASIHDNPEFRRLTLGYNLRQKLMQKWLPSLMGNKPSLGLSALSKDYKAIVGRTTEPLSKEAYSALTQEAESFNLSEGFQKDIYGLPETVHPDDIRQLIAESPQNKNEYLSASRSILNKVKSQEENRLTYNPEENVEIPPTAKIPVVTGNWENGETRPFAFDPNSTTNEGRFRLVNPDEFQEGMMNGADFNRWQRYKGQKWPGVSFVVGRDKTGTNSVQAIRFDKNIMDEGKAAQWWNENATKFGRELTKPPEEGAAPIVEKPTEPISPKTPFEMKREIEGVSGDEERGAGFSDVIGAVGQEKPMQVVVNEGSDAAAVQKMFNQQKADVKTHYRRTLRQIWDEIGGKIVDVTYGAKRRLMTDPNGQNVITKLDAIRGASSEAGRQVENAEKTVFKNLPRKYDELFGDYCQAMRTIEVEKKGIPQQENTFGTKTTIKSTGGITGKQIQGWLAEIKNQDPKGFSALESARAIMKDVFDEQLDQLAAEGLSTKEAVAEIKKNNEYYFPRRFIQHIDPESVGTDASGKEITIHDSGIKSLQEGSEQAMLNNPRLLMSQAIIRTQSRIAKNRANKALYELVNNNEKNVLDAKIAKNIKGTFEPTPLGYRPVSCFINGEEKRIFLPRQVAKYWVTSDPETSQLAAKIANVLSGSFLLKPMATGLNPEFAVANLPRDMVHSWFTTQEYSPILPFAVLQQLKDMAKVSLDVIKRKGRLTEYVKEGGGMNLLTQQGYINKTRPWESPSKVDEQIQSVQKVLGYIGETSEQLVRMAIRERAIKNGKSPEQATWTAANYIDFRQGGSMAKAIDHAVPYLNAGIQATRGIFRAFRENPKVAAFKTAQVMALGMGLAYWGLTKNKEAWNNISEREKESKFIIPLPWSYTDKEGNTRHAYVGIAKDQSQRFFCTLGEVLVERYAGNINGETAWKRVNTAIADFLPVDASSLMPPTMSAYVGYLNNKDFWTREDMWKGPKVEASQEYWKATPQIYKDLGSSTNLSPVRLQKSASRVFPKNIYTDLMETGWDQMMAEVSQKDRMEIEKAGLEQIVNAPGMRRVLRVTSPTAKTAELSQVSEKAEMKKNRESLDMYNRAIDQVSELKLKPSDNPKSTFGEFYVKEKELAGREGRKLNRAGVYRAYEKAFANRTLTPEEKIIYNAPNIAAREAVVDKILEGKKLSAEQKKREKFRMMKKYSVFMNPQGE